MRISTMIADSFNSRTLANMEVALELACKILAFAGEQHEARRYIASKIIECANGGDKTLGGLTEAGQIAASELCVTYMECDAAPITPTIYGECLRRSQRQGPRMKRRKRSNFADR